MNKRKWKGLIFLIGAVGVSIAMLMFVVSSTLIGYSVKEKCNVAEAEYGGECIQALIISLEDESKSFSDRNSTIWALGQLGDEQALPVLEKYFTGEIPGRSNLDQELSQLLLSRAIKLIRSGINLTAWAWR